MKVKIENLTGAALDWAVGRIEGVSYMLHGHIAYSQAWEHGGPIIERERITVRFDPECVWLFPAQAAWVANYEGVGEWHGPTPLIAAMRCYVASEYGDSINVPDELTGVNK